MNIEAGLWLERPEPARRFRRLWIGGRWTEGRREGAAGEGGSGVSGGVCSHLYAGRRRIEIQDNGAAPQRLQNLPEAPAAEKPGSLRGAAVDMATIHPGWGLGEPAFPLPNHPVLGLPPTGGTGPERLTREAGCPGSSPSRQTAVIPPLGGVASLRSAAALERRSGDGWAGGGGRRDAGPPSGLLRERRGRGTSWNICCQVIHHPVSEGSRRSGRRQRSAPAEVFIAAVCHYTIRAIADGADALAQGQSSRPAINQPPTAAERRGKAEQPGLSGGNALPNPEKPVGVLVLMVPEI